jgi:hypothetical protein
MKLIRSIAIIFCLGLLAACATERPVDAPVFQEVSGKQSGYARLYIFSPYNEIGRAIWPELVFNGHKIAGLKNASYTTLLLKPGHYEISTEKSSIFSGQGNIPGTMDVVGTGDFYLKFDRAYDQGIKINGSGYAEPGFTTKYERWTLVTRDQALPEISKCYFVAPYIDILP